MTDPGQRGPRSRVVAFLVGLLLLAALVMGTCRFSGRRNPSQTAEKPVSPASVAHRTELRAGIEIVSRDEVAGLITLRDSRTGGTIRLGTADLSSENVDKAFAKLIHTPESKTPPGNPTSAVAVAIATPKPAASDHAAEEKASGVPAGGGAIAQVPVAAPQAPDETLPSFVPAYPGSTKISIATNHGDGTSIHGDYEFSTQDTPAAVGEFYARKSTEGGLPVVANVAGSNQNGPTFTLIVEARDQSKSLSLTASMENGQTRGSVVFEAR
jgi:hypothetical protein